MRETVVEPARLGRAGTIECPHCHAQAPVDARFCPNCGRPLQSQAGQWTCPGSTCAIPAQVMLHAPGKTARLSTGAGQRGREGKWQEGNAPDCRGARGGGHGGWHRREGALAQDYGGSSVTTSDDTTGVEGRVLVLAPGVTISGGNVSNETGIGVVIGGGTSAAPRLVVARTLRLPNR